MPGRCMRSVRASGCEIKWHWDMTFQIFICLFQLLSNSSFKLRFADNAETWDLMFPCWWKTAWQYENEYGSKPHVSSVTLACCYAWYYHEHHQDYDSTDIIISPASPSQRASCRWEEPLGLWWDSGLRRWCFATSDPHISFHSNLTFVQNEFPWYSGCFQIIPTTHQTTEAISPACLDSLRQTGFIVWSVCAQQFVLILSQWGESEMLASRLNVNLFRTFRLNSFLLLTRLMRLHHPFLVQRESVFVGFLF